MHPHGRALNQHIASRHGVCKLRGQVGGLDRLAGLRGYVLGEGLDAFDVAPDHGDGFGTGEFGHGERHGAHGAACSDEEDAFSVKRNAGLLERPQRARAVGGRACQAAVLVGNGIDAADAAGHGLNFIQAGHDGQFVRDGDAHAAEAVHRPHTGKAGGDIFDAKRRVEVVQVRCPERRIMQDGREGMFDWIPDHGAEAGVGIDLHGLSPVIRGARSWSVRPGCAGGGARPSGRPIRRN